jgi:hypothetical protein
MSLLYTHSRELTSSLNELKEPSSSTDWILFGYDGDDITLINSGSNGLEEIKDEFDEESVQYALLKIFDETSKMLRFIYIAWCGEYAPPFQKANFSQHSQVLESFFKGYHVRINARCYEDVEPENIISKVQNSSFINFSTKVAPTPVKKPVFNLPNKPANSELRKLPTPSQLSQMKPTQSFQLGAKKPEVTQIPTPSVSPSPTKTTSAPAPAPAPRPNPLSPKANPLAPRANPLAPRTNPLAPRANPLAPRANPLSPKNKFASISKPAAPAPAPVVSKPAVSASSPKSTATSTTTSVPAPKPTPSIGYNPLNPRRNPLAPGRRNPLAPSRPNPLNQNAPLTEPTPSSQSEKVTIKPVTPVGPPRVSVKTNAFEGIKLELESEPVVENEGIDTTSRDSVANVRKMFEKKPEKKINKVMLKSQLFSEGNKEYATKARVREERLRREQEDNALVEREKLANKQRELQDEIAETRKANSPEPTPFRSNPLNSPKSNPLNTNKFSLSPKINPLNVNKTSPVSPKINPLNANKTSPVSPKINPLNANKFSLSPKINPLNANKTNPVSPKINPLNANKTNPVSPKINPLNPKRANPLNPTNSAPALPPRDTAPALPSRENPLAPKSNPLNPKRANPLNPTNSAPALPPRDTAPALPARNNPLAPPPLPQRVINSGSEEKEERERKEREERERKEREEKERKEREEKERKEREERERKEREEREKKEREEQEKLNARTRAASTGNGDYAIVAYDYEPQEENEIALVEGEIVKNIIQLDEGWWQGQNSKGEVGLFPANFVELQASAPVSAPVTNPVSAPAPVQKSSSAIALYDYDAQEDNEISFKEGDIITNLNFVTDDWWEGVVDGKCGLFPGNYVQVNQKII